MFCTVGDVLYSRGYHEQSVGIIISRDEDNMVKTKILYVSPVALKIPTILVPYMYHDVPPLCLISLTVPMILRPCIMTLVLVQ